MSTSGATCTTLRWRISDTLLFRQHSKVPAIYKAHTKDTFYFVPWSQLPLITILIAFGPNNEGKNRETRFGLIWPNPVSLLFPFRVLFTSGSVCSIRTACWIRFALHFLANGETKFAKSTREENPRNIPFRFGFWWLKNVKEIKVLSVERGTSLSLLSVPSLLLLFLLLPSILSLSAFTYFTYF